jgi:hypothetical protein
MSRLQIVIDIKKGEEEFLLSGDALEMLKQELKIVLHEYRLGFNKHQKSLKDDDEVMGQLRAYVLREGALGYQDTQASDFMRP